MLLCQKPTSEPLLLNSDDLSDELARSSPPLELPDQSHGMKYTGTQATRERREAIARKLPSVPELSAWLPVDADWHIRELLGAEGIFWSCDSDLHGSAFKGLQLGEA